MKKTAPTRFLALALCLSLLAGGALTGCDRAAAPAETPAQEQQTPAQPSDAPSAEAPSQEETPAETPSQQGEAAKTPASLEGQVVYPDTLPANWDQSDQAAQCRETGAVVVGRIEGGTGLEGPSGSKEFVTGQVEGFLDGSLPELWVCRVYGEEPDSASFRRYWWEEGGQMRTAVGDSVQETRQSENTWPVSDFALNEYGWITCQVGDFSPEEGNSPVISQRELDPDWEEHQQWYDTYFRPLIPTGIGGMNMWRAPVEIAHEAGGRTDKWIWLFEDIYGQKAWDEFGAQWPVDVMVETLSQYFEGLSAELFIQAAGDAYDPATNTIHYEGGRGGGPVIIRILDGEQQGDDLVISYNYCNYLDGSPHASENGSTVWQLTLTLREDGGFYYRSNMPAD